MTHSQPFISVLMAVYNGQEFLQDSIDSILSQTFSDFEFIIIDDGSTDKTVEIIEAIKDPRIRLIQNDRNLGLTNSLNKGFEFVHGKYIARMDCDDISLPTRFEEQVKFFKENPQIGACGTGYESFGDTPRCVWDPPTNSGEIKGRLLFESVLAHPTVMLNRNLFDAHGLRYNPEFSRAQDYDLWVRASDFFPLGNISQILFKYRFHKNRVSTRFKKAQENAAESIRINQIRSLGIQPGVDELRIHMAISENQILHKKPIIKKADTWLNRLLEQNKTVKYFPEPQFSEIIFQKWFPIMLNSRKFGLWAQKVFFHSQMNIERIPFRMKLKFFLGGVKLFFDTRFR